MQNTPINLLPTDGKDIVFNTISDLLSDYSLSVKSVDQTRPWGGFFVIDEADTQAFIKTFFSEYPSEKIQTGNLTPKILVVEPGKRLSWQYHYRRAELWKILSGPVGVVTSDSDDQGDVTEKHSGETVQFDTEVRHRLIGLENWGIVAEFWQHTDEHNPSDESDIVRVEDDFSRT